MVEILEQATYTDVPVFPLPDYVLFPQTLIPFHIFEDRYKQLVSDCLADQRLIVVAGLMPGWEDDYYGSPPVYPVAGFGKVVNEERLADGRLNIFVHSLARVRIVETTRTEPYRVARVDVIPDRAIEREAERLPAVMERLRSCVVGLASRVDEEARVLGRVLTSASDPGVLTNRLASVMVGDPRTRQSLLEQRSPLERASLLTSIAAERMFDSVDAVGASDEEAGAGWMN